MQLANTFVIYCDGACSGNPGPGGWGSIVATPDGTVTELGGAQDLTTNNQMELKAATEALAFLKDQSGDVVVYTDSVYVIRGITQWIWGWKKRNWTNAEGQDVANKDYWEKLLTVTQRRKKVGDVIWKFARGHVGIPGNERCDAIAVAFSKKNYVSLYRGPLMGYSVPVYDFPPDVPLPEMKQKTEKTAAFSYLSLVAGIPARHTTWADCERRVKGQSGAKFKKAASSEEEFAILKSWGVDPSRLKKLD